MTAYPALAASVEEDQARLIARRLLSDGSDKWEVESSCSHHPLWSVRFSVQRRSLVAALLPAELSVVVDAVSGRGHMVADARLNDQLVASTHAGPSEFGEPHRRPEVGAERAEQIARALAGAAMRKRAKLGMSFDLSVQDVALVLKPNWVITAMSRHAHARLLIDGFDGSHYVMSYG